MERLRSNCRCGVSAAGAAPGDVARFEGPVSGDTGHECGSAGGAVPHAVTITDPSAAAAGLDQVVPQVSGLPGFVAGYWMARSAEQGLAVIMFDSQAAAQSFADFLKTAPDEGGVRLDRDSIVVAEVLAHA